MNLFIWDCVLKNSRFLVFIVVVCVLLVPVLIGTAMGEIAPLHLGWRIAIGYVFLGISYALIQWNERRRAKEPSKDENANKSPEFEVFIQDGGIMWEQQGATSAIRYDAITKVLRRANLALIFGPPNSFVCVDLDQLDVHESELLLKNIGIKQEGS